jgi:hypothetical protein
MELFGTLSPTLEDNITVKPTRIGSQLQTRRDSRFCSVTSVTKIPLVRFEVSVAVTLKSAVP